LPASAKNNRGVEGHVEPLQCRVVAKDPVVGDDAFDGPDQPHPVLALDAVALSEQCHEFLGQGMPKSFRSIAKCSFRCGRVQGLHHRKGGDQIGPHR